MKKFLVFLFGLSFLIRILVFGLYLSKSDRYWQVDSLLYHNIAVSLADGKGITQSNNKPSFYRLPGYPLFLMPFYAIWGADYTTHNSAGVFAALLAQVFFASFIPLLIFFLSLTLFNWVLLAKVASVWSALHIGLVLYSGFFMTESLFLIFFLLFLMFFLKESHLFFCPDQSGTDKSGSGQPGLYEYEFDYRSWSPDEHLYDTWRWNSSEVKANFSSMLIFAGMLLGLAGLVRPVGHYLLGLSILFVLLGSRKRVSRSFMLCLGWLLPILPLLLRNFALTGHIFFHTLPGGHFLYLSASRVAMHVKECSYWEARDILTSEVRTEQDVIEKRLHRKLNEIEHCKLCEKVAVRYFMMRPLLTLKNWATDILRTSLSLYSSEILFLESGRKNIDYFKKGRGIWAMFKRYLFPQAGALTVLVWYEILTYLFVLIGFFLGFIKALLNKDKWCVWLRCLGFIGLFLIISLSGGYARMRLPIEPLLIILSFHYWLGLLRG